jgi:hypothetical protein
MLLRNLTNNLHCFKANYAASPETCANIFANLQTTEIAAAHMNKPNVLYFLMTMNWLLVYKFEEELAGTFKVVQNTAEKWIWEFAHKIQGLKADKVSTNNNSQLLCL